MSQPTELHPRPGLDLSISVALASTITLPVLAIILAIRGDWPPCSAPASGWA